MLRAAVRNRQHGGRAVVFRGRWAQPFARTRRRPGRTPGRERNQSPLSIGGALWLARGMRLFVGLLLFAASAVAEQAPVTFTPLSTPGWRYEETKRMPT